MVSMRMRLVISTTILCGLIVLVTGKCSSPPTRSGAHSELAGDEFDVGTKAVYKCLIGHAITSGTGQSTCILSEGTFQWTEPTMKCSPISCPEPDKPDNGRITGTDYSFGKVVNFECFEGYDMWSSDSEPLLAGENPTRVCTADGTWSRSTPVCKPVTCPDQRNVIDNGHADIPSSNFMAVITYSCNSGYQIKGDKQRRCLATGIWSGKEPECIGIRCLDPDDDDFKEKYPLVTAHLRLSVDPGHKAHFECSDDSRKNVMSTCTDTGMMGEWVPPPPQCVTITTPIPGAADGTTPEAGPHPVTSGAANMTTPEAGHHPVTSGAADMTTPEAGHHPVTSVPSIEIGATTPVVEVSVPPSTDAPSSDDGLPTWVVALLVVVPVTLLLGGVVAFLWKRSKRQHHSGKVYTRYTKDSY